MFIEDTWTVGSIAKQLREEQGISAAQLSYGLCSPITLGRIEAGEREMDLIFAVMLFGRLGYYPDKFELFGSRDEYAQYEQRVSIQKLKRKREYEQMALELAQYQKDWKAVIEKNRLQQQFVDSMRGFLCIQEKDHANRIQGVKLLEKAAAFTIPKWKGNWGQESLVSESELDILSMLADAFEASGDLQSAFDMRRNIYIYMEKKRTNRIQMLQLYTEIICKIVPVILKQHNVGQALEMCEHGLNALSEKGRLYHWPDLLYWKGRCLEELYRVGKSEKALVIAAYTRAYYIYRLLHMEEKAEKVKTYLDKEEPGWECIRLEKL